MLTGIHIRTTYTCHLEGDHWIFIKPEISRIYAVTDKDNTASRCVMEKLGMKHEKDVDLYDSVAEGYGLLPFYSIESGAYLG